LDAEGGIGYGAHVAASAAATRRSRPKYTTPSRARPEIINKISTEFASSMCVEKVSHPALCKLTASDVFQFGEFLYNLRCINLYG
jgi:hypothetical protein